MPAPCPVSAAKPSSWLKILVLQCARVPSDIITTALANAPALVAVRPTFTSVDVVDNVATVHQVTAPALTILHLLSAAAQVLSQPNITCRFPRMTCMTINIMQIDTVHHVFDIVHPKLAKLTLNGLGTPNRAYY